MGFAQSYTADVQSIAVVNAAGLEGTARNAEASLRDVHRDLPEIVNHSVKMLAGSGIDAGASKATAHRLTEALLRETAVGPDRLSQTEQLNLEGRALRSVLIQEAAAHEYEARTGKMDTYREFMGDRANNNGVKAMETLERQKVDTVALFGQATDAELTQLSVGAFDRTSRAQQERTAKALDANLEQLAERATGLEVPSNVRPLPVRGSVTRHPHGDARRQTPTFGRKMQPQLAQAAHAM
jgi:hypothetical protein